MILERYIDFLYNQHNKLFEIGVKQILYKLKDHTQNSLKKQTDKQILDLHRKCHMLYKSHKNKEFLKEVIVMHDMIVKEMLRRKMKHNSPLGE